MEKFWTQMNCFVFCYCWIECVAYQILIYTKTCLRMCWLLDSGAERIFFLSNSLCQIILWLFSAFSKKSLLCIVFDSTKFRSSQSDSLKVAKNHFGKSTSWIFHFTPNGHFGAIFKQQLNCFGKFSMPHWQNGFWPKNIYSKMVFTSLLAR